MLNQGREELCGAQGGTDKENHSETGEDEGPEERILKAGKRGKKRHCFQKVNKKANS